jgi:hypothetical protein
MLCSAAADSEVDDAYATGGSRSVLTMYVFTDSLVDVSNNDFLPDGIDLPR